jgi:long-chain fatty acid transport protein
VKQRLLRLPIPAALAGVLWLSGSPLAVASGFALPEVSAAGIGTANALVANPEEPGAFPYNSAAMGFHERSSLAVGGALIAPDFSVRTASGSHDSEGASWIGAPMIQGALALDERWRLGLSINAPFGLETRWALGTFPALSRPIPIAPGIALPAGLDHPTQSKLEVIATSPSVAYKVSDELSVAAGVDHYYAREATLNTFVTHLSGDGDAWGWNLSALFRHGPWSFGAAYRSKATVDIDGEVRVSDPTLLALGRPASQQASVDLDLPWRLQLGVRYAVNADLAVEFDWSRTGWSAFDKLVVESNSGTEIKNDTNQWDDTNAYRLGLTYRIQPKTQLRLGYTYDETGQSDDYFSGRVPDNDRHLFSLGVGHELAQGWSLDAGYMYVRFKDRRFRGDRPYVPGREVNGSAGLDGDYEGAAHLIGVELRKTF